MIVINRNGLTPEEAQKVVQPFARNTGQPIDFAVAGAQAVEFLKENPGLLEEVGRLLDKPQE